MIEKSDNGYPLVTEGYFGAEVEVLCFIKELKLYLVRLDGKFKTYNEKGEDGFPLLSSIDPEEFKTEIEKVSLEELDNFVKNL